MKNYQVTLRDCGPFSLINDPHHVPSPSADPLSVCPEYHGGGCTVFRNAPFAVGQEMSSHHNGHNGVASQQDHPRRAGLSEPDVDIMSRRERLGGPTFAAITSRSYHPGGVQSAMGDGSVRLVAETIDGDVWRSLGTVAGREPFRATLSDPRRYQIVYSPAGLHDLPARSIAAMARRRSRPWPNRTIPSGRDPPARSVLAVRPPCGAGRAAVADELDVKLQHPCFRHQPGEDREPGRRRPLVRSIPVAGSRGAVRVHRQDRLAAREQQHAGRRLRPHALETTEILQAASLAGISRSISSDRLPWRSWICWRIALIRGGFLLRQTAGSDCPRDPLHRGRSHRIPIGKRLLKRREEPPRLLVSDVFCERIVATSSSSTGPSGGGSTRP